MSTIRNAEALRNALAVVVTVLLSVAGTASASSGANEAEQGSEARTSNTRHVVQGGRDNPTVVRMSSEDYKALEMTGERSKTRGTSSKPGSQSDVAQSSSFDFWIYYADVVLFNDDDLDGYYHGIDLLFDADTIYSAAEVYAVVYLSFEGGPWNEYGATEDFWIFGASSSDEYVLITELMSGYPAGSYDLLIELFDAGNGAFLASFGPEDTSELGFLPLEDFVRDTPINDRPVAVSRGGGGSLDHWTLGLLFLLIVVSAARKVWRHRNDALIRIDSPAPIWQVRDNDTL